MNKTLRVSIAAVAACFVTLAYAAEGPKSMRGIDVAAPDAAAEVKEYVGKRPGTQAPVSRTFSTQPPVIPHSTDNFDEITLESNQCLDCHGASTYKKKKAPKIGDSHFITREGAKLEEASAARHNCQQCHVPQVDAPPLVENEFKGDEAKKPGAAASKKATRKN